MEIQVTFTADELIDAVHVVPHGSVVLFDEPGQAWFSREFMSQANRLLSKTMMGFRFKKLIYFYCMPVMNQIDKAARDSARYKAYITARGLGQVYRVIPARFQGETFYRLDGTMRTKKPSVKLRHAYEKKK